MPASNRSLARLVVVPAALVLLTAVGIDGPLPVRPFGPGVATAAESPPCVDGFDIVAPTWDFAPDAVVARSADSALFAGGGPAEGGAREAAIAILDGDGWRVTERRRVGDDSAYVALDDDGRGSLWAVGYTRTPSHWRPLAARLPSAGAWQPVATPSRRGGATLTDVAGDRGAGTWAAGYTIGRPGGHGPWALRWDGERFVDRSPRLDEDERGRLTSISVSDEGGIWIAGATIRGGVTRPYIARRARGAWERMPLPPMREAVVADIDVHAPGAGVAVGHRLTSRGVEPVVLRWDGTSWSRAGSNGLPGDQALLMGALSSTDGRTIVVGATWDRSSTRYEGLAAQLGHDGWVAGRVTSFPGQMGLFAVDAVAGGPAWIAGGTPGIGAGLRTCDSATPARAARRATRDRRERRARAAVRNSRRGGHDRAPSARRGTAPPREIPRLRLAADVGLTSRDLAAEVGIPERTESWGGVIADFDGDGADDIFVGRHGSPPYLLLDDGGTFVDVGVNLGQPDRHGCAAADIDDSGLPDLYCSIGARRGTGVKANQLWLDPAAPTRAVHPLAGRALEPHGRGRVAAFVDIDLDGDDDLYVGQDTQRVDGLPSDGRVYLRTGPARFRPLSPSGIDPLLVVSDVSTGDVNADGRTDLLVVHTDPYTIRVVGGVRLYQNVGGRFRDVTRRSDVRSIAENDAELARLDGDRRADLVQLSWRRVRISLRRGSGFRTVFERRIDGGVAMAVGDADGDGDRDIYVLRQKHDGDEEDVLLRNLDRGRDWDAVAVRASRKGGTADDVYAIDHDDDGTVEFLTLNGLDGPGPTQLIAFGPPD